MQDFVNGEKFRPFSEEPTGMEIRGYNLGKIFKPAASQSPSKTRRAAAAGKTATRRLISRIILASVVNASSRRRRGLTLRPVGYPSDSLASCLRTKDHNKIRTGLTITPVWNTGDAYVPDLSFCQLANSQLDVARLGFPVALPDSAQHSAVINSHCNVTLAYSYRGMYYCRTSFVRLICQTPKSIESPIFIGL